MKIVGIDPGKDGSSCFYSKYETPMFPDRTEERLKFYDAPLDKAGDWDPWLMLDLVEHWDSEGVEKVVIEECHAFPGISAAANASVMEAYGMWMSALAASFNRNQIVIVGAATWKKAMGVVSPVICGCGIREVRRSIRFSNGKNSIYTKEEKAELRSKLLRLLVTHEGEKKAAYEARKALSLKVARERFPSHPFRTIRGRDLDGQAEAFLIALYGAQHG